MYEGEEHALRVLMEEEVMEAMASSKTGKLCESEVEGVGVYANVCERRWCKGDGVGDGVG